MPRVHAEAIQSFLERKHQEGSMETIIYDCPRSKGRFIALTIVGYKDDSFGDSQYNLSRHETEDEAFAAARQAIRGDVLRHSIIMQVPEVWERMPQLVKYELFS
jgi:hypothetical protein